MYALILRDEEIYRAQFEGVQEGDIDLVVRFVDRAVSCDELIAGREPDPAQRLKFIYLAPRNSPAAGVVIACYVGEGALMDKYPNSMLKTQLEKARKDRRDLFVVFKLNDDIGIN